MANPQKENGYTAISNEIMQALSKTRINGEARQVLDFILFKTYGFNKKSDGIPLSQFTKGTGIQKSHVIRAIKTLKNMNIIVAETGNETWNIYAFNKDFDKWKSLPKLATLPKLAMSVAEIGNASLPKSAHSKTTTSKTTISIKENNIKEKNRFVLSDVPSPLITAAPPSPEFKAFQEKAARLGVPYIISPKDYELLKQKYSVKSIDFDSEALNCLDWFGEQMAKGTKKKLTPVSARRINNWMINACEYLKPKQVPVYSTLLGSKSFMV